ncbi:MAG: hypothetical protein ACK4ND_07530 [Cytophagaceae bacterium]
MDIAGKIAAIDAIKQEIYAVGKLPDLSIRRVPIGILRIGAENIHQKNLLVLLHSNLWVIENNLQALGMINISVEELAQYFTFRKKPFTTTNGLYIHFSGEEIYTQYQYPVSRNSEFEFSLYTEGENLHEFIQGYKIESVNDIDNLDYRNILIRYLNREATMEVISMEMEEAPVNFRLHKFSTMVFSIDMHFYDEENRHLTLPEDFVEYFQKNEGKLQVAFENRYKF